MAQFGAFADLPSIRVGDGFDPYERTWPSNTPYYSSWGGSLATRFSHACENEVPMNFGPSHDMHRYERFLVEPHFSYSAEVLQPTLANGLPFSRPYEAAFPQSYPRQPSPTDTNHSSQHSVCHSDDASTDRTARHSLSSNSDYSYSPHLTCAAYPALPAQCNEQITSGGGIALSAIQQYPDESPIDTDEYQTAEEMEEDRATYEHDSSRLAPKVEPEHHHGNGLLLKEEPADYDGAESELPDAKEEEDESDQDYKPNRKSSINKRPKRRSSQSSAGSNSKGNARRPTHGRKSSLCSNNNDRVSKSKGHKKKLSTSDAIRPFPCPFAGYQCESTFTSKNEWKRHVSTQHIKLGFWRCDMCPPTNSNDQYNDFNRKDLYTQHLRRMHADVRADGSKSPTSPVKKGVSLTNAIPEDVITEHQTRCYIRVRSPPPKSSCLFCPRSFAGTGSWADRMDHVGSHFERDRKNGPNGAKVTDVEAWREDKTLRDWLKEEGLIEADEHGGWKIGAGVPLRERHESAHE